MGAVGPSMRHLVEAVGTEKLMTHGESIDGMAGTGVALALIVGKGLTGASNGDGARNATRWPVDAPLRRVRQTDWQAGDRCKEDDAKGGEAGSLGSL